MFVVIVVIVISSFIVVDLYFAQVFLFAPSRFGFVIT